MPSVNEIVEATARRYGIDPRVAHALVGQESGGSNDATSPVGAAGVMQIMPDTARGLGLKVGGGVDERRDPVKNIDAGMRFFKQQLDKYGSYPLALAAYNAGPGAVDKYGGVPPYQETQTYVRNIMGVVNRGGGAVQPSPGGAAMPPPTRTAASTPTLQRPAKQTSARAAAVASMETDYDAIQSQIKTLQAKSNDPNDDGSSISALKAAQADAKSLLGKIQDAKLTIATDTDKPDPAAKPAKTKQRTYKRDGVTVTEMSTDDEPFDPIDGADDPDALTPYQSGSLANTSRGQDIELQLGLLSREYQMGSLDEQKTKQAIMEILAAKPAVTGPDGKRYVAGTEPGGKNAQFFSSRGFNLTPEPYRDIDYLGIRDMGDKNQYVHGDDYAFGQAGLTGADVSKMQAARTAGVTLGRPATAPGAAPGAPAAPIPLGAAGDQALATQKLQAALGSGTLAPPGSGAPPPAAPPMPPTMASQQVAPPSPAPPPAPMPPPLEPAAEPIGPPAPGLAPPPAESDPGGRYQAGPYLARPTPDAPPLPPATLSPPPMDTDPGGRYAPVSPLSAGGPPPGAPPSAAPRYTSPRTTVDPMGAARSALGSAQTAVATADPIGGARSVLSALGDLNVPVRAPGVPPIRGRPAPARTVIDPVAGLGSFASDRIAAARSQASSVAGAATELNTTLGPGGAGTAGRPGPNLARPSENRRQIKEFLLSQGTSPEMVEQGVDQVLLEIARQRGLGGQ